MKYVVYAQFCLCNSTFYSPSRLEELNNQHRTPLLFSQTWSFLFATMFKLLHSLFRFPFVRLKLPTFCGCASFSETLMALRHFLLFH